MRSLRRVTVVLLCLVPSSALSAADTADVAAMIQKLEKKSASITTYKTRVATKVEVQGESIKSTAMLLYKKPDKLRLDVKLPRPAGQQLIISNGKTLWIYVPSANKVSKIDIVAFKKKNGGRPPATPVKDISSPFRIGKTGTYKYLGEEIRGPDKCLVFECLHPVQKTPSGGSAVPNKMKIWVRAADGIALQTQTHTSDGQCVITQTYEELQLGLAIEDSQFEFTPPPGTPVTDVTNRADK